MKYVALLRGINVGGKKKVEMKKLKSLFEKIGFSNVLTYINSGNVIFETESQDYKKIESIIESSIKKFFGFDVPTVIRSQIEIERINKRISPNWTNDKDFRTDVMFLWDDINDKDSLNQIETNPDVDVIIYLDGAMVWHIDRKNYGKSKLHDLIKNKLYKKMTIRNINTVRKIQELMTV